MEDVKPVITLSLDNFNNYYEPYYDNPIYNNSTVELNFGKYYFKNDSYVEPVYSNDIDIRPVNQFFNDDYSFTFNNDDKKEVLNDDIEYLYYNPIAKDWYLIRITAAYILIKNTNMIKFTYSFYDALYDINDNKNLLNERLSNPELYFIEYLPIYYGDINKYKIREFLYLYWNNKYYIEYCLNHRENKFIDLIPNWAKNLSII